MRLGVLASHEGTTLQAILDACADGRLPASVAVVISNNRESGSMRRATAAGVPALHLSRATHPDPAALDAAIRSALVTAGVDLVFLAGYMRKLGPLVLEAFAGRILNTHPALLPQFGGAGMFGSHVHEAVLRAGAAESGATIHVVDSEYDTGRIVAQRRVPVQPGDTAETLAARVQAAERALVVDTLARVAQGRLALA
jgi:phosphoribosylglycinamide formyltransferase-1